MSDAIVSVSTSVLNLDTFGKRVLRILRNHRSRLTFAGDVILHVGKLFSEQASETPPTITQAIVDGWTTDEIHAIIRDCSQRLRLDRWQERKRATAVTCSAMIEMAVQPIKVIEPNAGQAKLLALAIKRLRVDVREMLEAGYSVTVADYLVLNNSKSELRTRLDR